MISDDGEAPQLRDTIVITKASPAFCTASHLPLPQSYACAVAHPQQRTFQGVRLTPCVTATSFRVRSSWHPSLPWNEGRTTLRRKRGTGSAKMVGFYGGKGEVKEDKRSEELQGKSPSRISRKKSRRRYYGVGADAIVVELLRWWFKNCNSDAQRDFGVWKHLPSWLRGLKSSDSECETTDFDEIDIDGLEIDDLALTDSFGISEKELQRSKDKQRVSYAEFPLTLRMGLSVNSDRLASMFVVVVADLLCDLIVWDIFHKVHGTEDLARVLIGASLAYIFGDLVSGVYHWVRHNFDAFNFDFDFDHEEENDASFTQLRCQGYKEEATKDFYRTVATHCLASVPFLALLWISPHSDLTIQSFGVYILSIVSILPAFKQWTSSESPPRAVSILQRAGLMLSKSEKAISDMEYCIVSGVWNNILSTTKFFTRLEHLIVYMTQGKLVPKSWSRRNQPAPEQEVCDECGDGIASAPSSDSNS